MGGTDIEEPVRAPGSQLAISLPPPFRQEPQLLAGPNLALFSQLPLIL